MPSSSGPVVMLVDHARLHQLSLQVRRILMEQPSGKMFAGEFLRTFWNYFNQTVDLDQLDKQLAGIIQVCHMWLPEVSWCVTAISIIIHSCVMRCQSIFLLQKVNVICSGYRIFPLIRVY